MDVRPLLYYKNFLIVCFHIPFLGLEDVYDIYVYVYIFI